MIRRLLVFLLAVLPGPVALDACGESPPTAAELRQIREIIVRRGNDAAAPAQLIQLTRALTPDVAAELFEEIAAAHVVEGRLSVAADYRKLLIESYPDQPAARDAAVWLLTWMGSSELATLQHMATSADAASATAVRVDPAVLYAALHFADDAVAATPSLGDDPEFTFLRSVAARQRTGPAAAAGLWSMLKHRGLDDLWQRRAVAETWLEQRAETDRPRATEPQALAHCLPTRRRPTLDGRLDELLWQSAQPIQTEQPHEQPQRATSSPAARARFGYDQHYLYVALDVPKVAGEHYPVDRSPRTQDGADLELDRIVLKLDPDRDYATSYELTVDCRGWPADAVWGQAAWNPQWLIAHRADGQRWYVEAAIEWRELTPAAPTRGDAWVVSVDRLMPGVGAGASASDQRLLLFE